MVAVTFLLLNGYYITASEMDVLEIITGLAGGTISLEAHVVWFKKTIVPH